MKNKINLDRSFNHNRGGNSIKQQLIKRPAKSVIKQANCEFPKIASR